MLPKREPMLIHAALLSTKDEAGQTFKHVMAQVNNDHSNFPSEVVFRLHSDRGGEFLSEDLIKWCDDKGIHKTTTAGYDPNANSAESTVGTLKRRSRYLLSGNRFRLIRGGACAP